MMASHVVAKRAPKSYWKNLTHQRQAFDSLAHQQNITDPTGWYKVHTQNLLSHHGITTILTGYYKGCLYKALTSLYPDQKFDFWKFSRVPKHFWQDKFTQKQFLDSVEKTLGITTKDAWYSVDGKKIRELGGASLLHYFGGSVPHALAHVYPEYKWKMWLFKEPPSGFWDDIQNQRLYMDWLAGELGITDFEQWYQVSIQQVKQRPGSSMIARYYQTSLPKALQSIYPEYPWQLWRFQYCRLPIGFYDHDHNAYAFLKWFSEQYGITNMNDWYSVSQLHFDKAGGFSLRMKHGDLQTVLVKYFPQHKWNFQFMKERLPSKAQVYLQRVVQNIFPHEEMKANSRIKNLAYSDTKREMEFDVYLPKHKLILEYQGEQHYVWSTLCGSADFQNYKDTEKKQACVEAGITLIEIPFWWDRQQSSILATILKHRPDLAPFIASDQVVGTPISNAIPQKYLKRKTHATIFSEFTSADSAVIGDPTGWWLRTSQGVNVAWNGKDFDAPLPIDSKNALALKSTLPADTVIEATLQHKGGVVHLTIVNARTASQIEIDTDQRIKLLQAVSAEVSQKAAPFGIQVEVAQFVQIQSKQDLLLQYSKADEDGATHLVLEPPHFAHADVSAIKLANYPTEYGLVVAIDSDAIKCQLFDSSTYLIRIPKDSSLQKLQPGSVVSFNYVTLESPTATNIEWNPTMKWTDVETMKQKKSTPPYVLTLGRSIGHFPKCQGCGKWIDDRKLPRIEVKAAYRSPSRPYPHPIKLSLCANSQCVEKAMKMWRSKKIQSVYMPPFQNQIGVLQNVKPLVSTLQHMSNIDWVEVL